MQHEERPPRPTSETEAYKQRRQHVLWYGSAVLIVLVLIVILQVLS